MIVAEAHPRDMHMAVARIDRETMAKIGAAEGDTLIITGKRRAVARCVLLAENDFPGSNNTSGIGNTKFVRLTIVVRNNAESTLGSIVQVSKAGKVMEARKVTLTSDQKELLLRFKDARELQKVAPRLSNTPVLKGDYIISFALMGPWSVFEVAQIEPSPLSSSSPTGSPSKESKELPSTTITDRLETADGGTTSYEIPAIITEKTDVLVVDQQDADRSNLSARELGETATASTTLRGYPIFWITVNDSLKKIDSENVYLVMTFTSLHSGGMISGQIEKKINMDSDIQSIVAQYEGTAHRVIDTFNEEARARSISPSEVKNRVLQKWMEV